MSGNGSGGAIRGMEDVKSVDQLLLDDYEPINRINNFLGIGIISLKRDTLARRSVCQTIYTSGLLLLFLTELGYLLTYIDTLHDTESTIINLTHFFHLFTENIVSCICLINVLAFSDTFFRNVHCWMKSEQILLRLGIRSDFFKQRMTIYFVIGYGIILPAIFFLDYQLLFTDEREKYISYQLWLFLLGHVFYNNFVILNIIYSLQVMKDRFMQLNNAMRDLHQVAVHLPLTERVMLVKRAHDNLYGIIAHHWTPHSLASLGELGICAVLTTSYMYTITSMVIDGHYNGFLLAHCSYWVLYSVAVILILVLNNVAVCTQCNGMAISIHQLLNKGGVQEGYIQLKNFSLQRLHQKLRIMACGLFAIDFSLLFELAGAITTHLVILIQFKALGDSNKSSGTYNPIANE